MRGADDDEGDSVVGQVEAEHRLDVFVVPADLRTHHERPKGSPSHSVMITPLKNQWPSVPARHISEGAVLCPYCLVSCPIYTAPCPNLQNVNHAVFVFSDSRCKNACKMLADLCPMLSSIAHQIVPRPRFVRVLDYAQFLLHPALFPTGLAGTLNAKYL